MSYTISEFHHWTVLLVESIRPRSRPGDGDNTLREKL